MISWKIKLVEVTRGPSDFGSLGFQQLENLRRLVLQQLGRKIGRDYFHHLRQFGEFGAQPCSSRPDFQDPAAELESALVDQKWNEAGQVLMQTTCILRFTSGLRGFTQRECPLVRIT